MERKNNIKKGFAPKIDFKRECFGGEHK